MEHCLKQLSTPFGDYFFDVWTRTLYYLSNQTLLGLTENACSNDRMGGDCVKDGFVDYLTKQGFEFGEAPSEIKFPNTDGVVRRLGRGLNLMILQITQQCNLRCDYCIYSESSKFNRSHSNKTMSFETAKASIDYFHDHSIDAPQVTIGFYGGEPFLRFDFMKDVMEYADKIFEGKAVSYHVTSNGTLMSSEAMDFLIENREKLHLLLSLDGPRSIQDSSRRYPDGRGTYNTVISNIKEIIKRCPEYKKNLRFNAVVDTKKEYAALSELSQEKVLSDSFFQFNYVEIDGTTSDFDEGFVSEHEYDVFLGFVAYYRDGRNGYPNKLIEHEFRHVSEGMRRFAPNSAATVSVPSGICQPGLTRLFVTTDGNMFPCERVSENSSCMSIGRIPKGIDTNKVSNLLNICKLCEERCLSCWAYSLCSVCAKRFDGGETLSTEKLEKACRLSKREAFDRVEQKIIQFEYDQHQIKLHSVQFAKMA